MKKDKEVKKEKEERMSPEHEAKRSVLKNLSKEMSRHMGEGIKSHLDKPMKKVSVMAPDSESLKKGLEVASKLSPAMDEVGDAAEEAMEGMDHEPRDMDEVAEEHEETEHEMPPERAEKIAERRVQDDENESEMEKLKKHLSKTHKA
jgi:hypothetical protein